MGDYKKVKIKFSYEIEVTLNDELYWKGATDEEMIKEELENTKEDPFVYLDIGLENETYKAVIEDKG